jgi:hypothetical protein
LGPAGGVAVAEAAGADAQELWARAVLTSAVMAVVYFMLIDVSGLG